MPSTKAADNKFIHNCRGGLNYNCNNTIEKKLLLGV